MKLEVLGQKGKNKTQYDLDDKWLGFGKYDQVLLQYIKVFRSNQRQGTQATKTRGEVSGGGRKPWQQKGTGRARVGSSRNPIWTGGGVSHGPKPRSWRLDLPKRTKRLAFKAAFSLALQEGRVKVVEIPKIEKPKTKEMVSFLSNLGVSGKTLIIIDGLNEGLKKSVSNIPGVGVCPVETVCPYDIAGYKNILITKEAMEILVSKRLSI